MRAINLIDENKNCVLAFDEISKSLFLKYV
jgi:hypothetical protein